MNSISIHHIINNFFIDFEMLFIHNKKLKDLKQSSDVVELSQVEN